MAADSGQRFATPQIIAIVGVAVLAVVVGVLAMMALTRGDGAPTDGEAAPVPTFELGVNSSSPTPTETDEPAAEFARADERFLAVGTGVMWRAIAGQCGEVAPLVERSTDGGQTWADVTPLYKGIGQIATLDPFADVQAEMVASMTDACETQALRTFTQGQYWESYPDVLAGSRYIDPADPALVRLGGDDITAPCDTAHGLRAGGDTIALVCDGTAHVFVDGGWMPLPAAGAVAVAVRSDIVTVAHTAEGCDGLALTQYTGADAVSAPVSGCVADIDPATSTALATGDGRYLLWSGDNLVVVE